MPEVFTVKTGFILPNGMFIPNAGNGHPYTAQMFCQNEVLLGTQFSKDMGESNLPWEDSLVMAGALALASRIQSDGTIKNHIRSCDHSFHTEVQEVAVKWIMENKGYVLFEGWHYNPNWGEHLKEALSAHESELNLPSWEEIFFIVEEEKKL